MKRYKFEIQNLINVIQVGETRELARQTLIENLELYADDIVDGSCYVSDGIPLRKEDALTPSGFKANYIEISKVLGLVEWLKQEICLHIMDNKICEQQGIELCDLCKRLDEGVKNIR